MNRSYIFLMMVLGLFVLAACSDDNITSVSSPQPPESMPSYRMDMGDGSSRGISIPLDLGSSTQSETGYIYVYNDAQNLYLSYYMNGSWRILGSFLHFGRTNADIPLDDANRPATDRFQYRFALERGMAVHNVVIPLAEIGMSRGDNVVIASYASVYQEGEDPNNITRVGMGASWWQTLSYLIQGGSGPDDSVRESAVLLKRAAIEF